MKSLSSDHRFGRNLSMMFRPPGRAAYAAAKFGAEGFSESLSKKVGALGIKVTIVEPGGFRTDFAASSTERAKVGRSMTRPSARQSVFSAITPESNRATR
jgi:NAD(P)-dependent dehydrogenase (short-subunit alcohol dehydrogenase family)